MKNHHWDILKIDTILAILRAVQRRDLTQAMVSIQYLSHILETEKILSQHADTINRWIDCTSTTHGSSSR